MRTILLLLVFILKIPAAYCQAESINQFDSNHQQDGKWILYLDAKGNKVNDSASATYWRYTYYDHGTHIYPMGGFITRNGKIESTDKAPQTGKITMLDGEYKCYENGKLKFIHTFSKGEYVSYKEFDKSGRLRSFFDYTKHYEGQPHSWYLILYDKTGKIKFEEWVKKDDTGHWPKMRG